MAGMAVRTGAGPCVIQAYESGSDPTKPARTVYTTASWTFNPGVTQTDLTGPHGTVVAVVPTAAAPTLTLSHMETPVLVQAGRMLGKNTFGAAVAGETVRCLDGFQTGDDLKDRAGLQAALRALTLAAEVVPGVYEADVAVVAGGTGTGNIRRLSPSPADVGEDEVFTSFATADVLTLFGTSPTEGSTGKVLFAVEGAIRESVDIDFREPEIMLHRITCFDGGEGNTAVYLSVQDAVASEASMAATRGEVAAGETTYKVLGGQADMRIVEFEKRVAGISGIV